MKLNKKAEGESIVGVVIVLLLVWGIIGYIATLDMGNSCKMRVFFLCFSWERNTIGQLNDFFNTPEMKDTMNSINQPLEDMNRQMAEQNRIAEEQRQKAQAEKDACIAKAKVALPETITLRVDNYQYDAQNNPDTGIAIGGCSLRKGTNVGENVNEYYGGCGFSYSSSQLLTKDGTILEGIHFSGSITKLAYISGSDSETDAGIVLKDFKVVETSFDSCAWINVDQTQIDCTKPCMDTCGGKGLQMTSSEFDYYVCRCRCDTTCRNFCQEKCDEKGLSYVNSTRVGDTCKCSCG